MMKNFYLVLFICTFHTPVFSQTLCGTTGEGSSVSLTAPIGKVFIQVTFASYGTPNGICGSFTTSGCHATNSISIVEGYLLGKNSATIPATNGVFGDPCQGTVKRLYVEAVYGDPLPLKLTSFSGIPLKEGNSLKWETTEEKNTKLFKVERSINGSNFSTIGTVASANRRGMHQYSFIDKGAGSGTWFYRLKLVDMDGGSSYSKIISLENSRHDDLIIAPIPTRNTIELSGLTGNGIIELLSLRGKVLQHLKVSFGTHTLDMGPYPGGIYILRYVKDKAVVYKRILKQ